MPPACFTVSPLAKMTVPFDTEAAYCGVHVPCIRNGRRIEGGGVQLAAVRRRPQVVWQWSSFHGDKICHPAPLEQSNSNRAPSPGSTAHMTDGSTGTNSGMKSKPAPSGTNTVRLRQNRRTSPAQTSLLIPPASPTPSPFGKRSAHWLLKEELSRPHR